MTNRWYVLSCKARKELVVWQRLQDQGFDVFCPQVHNSTELKLMEPYFPGYLFVKLDLSKDGYSVLQWMPDSEGLVFIGEKPAYVPDPIVRAIHTRLNRINDLAMADDNNFEDPNARADLRIPPECQGTIFDNQLSSGERTNELLRMLEGLSLSPE